jgi:hypothetical protein
VVGANHKSAAIAWRDATTFKVQYGTGLRPFELVQLQTCDLLPHPVAAQFGRYAVVRVGWGKRSKAGTYRQRSVQMDPDEIHIAALVDARVVIGEAKRIASLGTRRETNRAVQKPIRVSDLVSAEEIVLATTAPGPWEDLATGQLLTATAGHRWRFGTVPRIRVLTDQRGNPQNTLLN